MVLHDFIVDDIHGNKHDLSQYKGKKILLVNTASECGFTNQFANLEELHETFGPDKFEVIGFPSNDFGGQDPGTNEEILRFCQVNYGVKFPMMAKVKILGDDAHPLFKWIKEELDTEFRWNFQKVLIDEDGKIVKILSPKMLPIDDEIVNWIQS